ncbi:hypothetical protein B0H10DRAFT_2242208 [Mycena sp. CBHHK59/15]|nr:hypothetical protein B0H10DRAFT_2242208 [Mycena sp. CBHHK59/15]
MWRELGSGKGDTLTLLKAERSTGEDVEVNMLMAGLHPPWSFNDKQQADTTYTWISMDGYSASFDHLAAKTIIKRDECIGEEVELAWDMFHRLAQDSLACGDNTIASLIHSSKSGLSVFLPPLFIQSTDPSPSEPIILPLELPLEAPPLPQNARAFAVRLLMRYAYIIGDSPTTFIGIKSVSQGERLLKSADMRKDIALMCINDDLGDGDQKAANEMLRNWFERCWPEKLQCE